MFSSLRVPLCVPRFAPSIAASRLLDRPALSLAPRLGAGKRYAGLALILLALCTGCHSTPAPPTADLAITNVTVIDAAQGQRAQRTVLIAEGTIVAEQPASAPFVAAQTIDAAGRFLLPGLWDMHVHVSYEPALVAQMASLFLDYGITSVRDTGGLLDRVRPIVDTWRSKDTEAPHIYFSGPLLDGSRVVYDGNDRPEIGTANPDSATARANVAKLKAAGADFIKIYEMVSPKVFTALADAADATGMPIAAHVPLSLAASQAGPRLGSLEHLRNLELACTADADQLLRERRARLENEQTLSGHALRTALHREQRTRAFAALDVDSTGCQQVLEQYRNTIQVPTLRLNTISRFSPAARNDWPEALSALPAELAHGWYTSARYFAERPNELGLKSGEWSLSLVNAMVERGIVIGAGTDTPIAQAIPGYSLHTELERLVTAGLTPLQAIDAATRVPARFLRLKNANGTVAAGQRADLLLLDANPLEDIRNSRRIAAVLLAGELVRSPTLSDGS